MLSNSVYYGAVAHPKIFICCFIASAIVQNGVDSMTQNLNLSESALKVPANIFGFVYTPSFVHSISDAQKKNLDKLNEIAALRENWNGYGASAFSPQLIEKTRNIVLGLSIQPEVFPTADDSIQIEYEGPRGSYLEIQVTESDVFDVLRVDHEGKEDVFRVSADIGALDQLVRNFYGSELS